ncbi:MAG: hypothetical protein PHP55_00075 [Methanoculleus sp.]|nr:hypothetical protein [Methanoculleus sp.]
MTGLPGIWGIISDNKHYHDLDLSDFFHREATTAYLRDHMRTEHAVVGRCSIDKFANDKAFDVVRGKLICTDGVIFNLRHLSSRYRVTDCAHTLFALQEEDGWSFPSHLRGNFSGYIYDLDTHEMLIFTDHLAQKPVYFFTDPETNTLIFGSDLMAVVEGMRALGFVPSVDVGEAYSLLSLGFMFENGTLVEGVRKLPPGNVLVYSDGKVVLHTYHSMSGTPYVDDDEEEILEELDRRFVEAIRMEYEKDLEYGYSHIATLSGGLDSRINVGYADKCRFAPITCFCFSESGYADESIAKKISSDHNFDFIFFSLDNGNYLTRYVNEVVGANGGLTLYGGAAHLYTSLRALSFQSYGLIHTGEAGEVLKGDLLSAPEPTSVNLASFETIAYSDRLLEKLIDGVGLDEHRYETHEQFELLNRGVNAVFNGNRMIEHFTEFSSPFLYVDFIDYCMRIHPRHRYNGNIYIKWMNRYLPEFSRYSWERYGLPPKYPHSVLFHYNNARCIVRKFVGRRHVGMNPTQHWWETNPELRERVNALFEADVNTLDSYPELAQDARDLFRDGKLLEKVQVITLLTVLRRMRLA